jgi:predicted hydrolase (HD superfamily)
MRDKAVGLLNKYVLKDEKKEHSFIVESIMTSFAKFLNPDQIEIWSIAGLLHDLDCSITSYKLCPQLHGLKAVEILKDENFGNDEIYSIMAAHNEKNGIKAESIAQKTIIPANLMANIISKNIGKNSKNDYIKLDSITILKDIDIFDRQKIESIGIKFDNFVNISIDAAKKLFNQI